MSVHRASSDPSVPFRSGTAGRGKAKPTWDAASLAYILTVIVLVAETVLMARNFALSVTDAHTVILVYIQAAHQNMATVCATRVAAWVWCGRCFGGMD